MESDKINGGLSAGNVTEDSIDIRSKLELLNLLERASSDVFWIMDLQLKTIYMSPSVERNLGYTADEYLNMPLSERLPEDSFLQTQNVMHTEILPVVKGEKPDSGKPVVYEMLHKHKDGRMAWGEVSINFLYDNQAKISSIMGVTRNIDARKRAQLELAESREQYRQLLEKSPDWIWEIDSDNKFTYINAAPERVLGILSRDLIGKSPFDFSTAETVENEKVWFENIKQAGLPFSDLIQVILDRYGRQVFLEISGTPVFDHRGKVISYRGIGRDVTEKQTAIRKLEKLEKNKHFIMRLPDFALIELDERLEIIEWSAGASHIFGYDRNSALIENLFLKLWEPARRKSIIATIKRKVKSQEARTLDSLNIKDDGTSIRCRWFIDSRFDSNGKFSGALLVVSEITDLFRISYLADCFDSLLDYEGLKVFFTDPKLNITYASGSMRDLLAESSQSLIGSNARNLFGKESFSMIAGQGISYAKMNQKWSKQVRMAGKDGEFVDRKLEITGVKGSSGKISGYIFLLESAD